MPARPANSPVYPLARIWLNAEFRGHADFALAILVDHVVIRVRSSASTYMYKYKRVNIVIVFMKNKYYQMIAIMTPISPASFALIGRFVSWVRK